MFRQDLKKFEDEQLIQHPASVVGYTKDGAVFQDEEQHLYLLPLEDPSMFELGITMDVNGGSLIPVVADLTYTPTPSPVRE